MYMRAVRGIMLNGDRFAFCFDNYVDIASFGRPSSLGEGAERMQAGGVVKNPPPCRKQLFAFTTDGKNAVPTNQPSVSVRPVMLMLWYRARILASRGKNITSGCKKTVKSDKKQQSERSDPPFRLSHSAFRLKSQTAIRYRLSAIGYRLVIVLRTGEPPARVPHAETVHRTVSPPLLRFWNSQGFADCGQRPKAPPLDSASL